GARSTTKNAAAVEITRRAARRIGTPFRVKLSFSMWHPSPPVKHIVSPARWPTAEQAARSRLFSPLAAGRLRLRHRTWVPAMVPWRATEDGFTTDDVIDWYARFARGRPGAIVVEATGIRDVPSGPLLRIGHDRFVPGLARLVEAVRRESGGQTRLFIQLIDFLTIRRRPDDEIRNALLRMSDDQLQTVLTPREWESLAFGFRERVTDVEVPHIRDLPDTLPDVFAAAAGRAQAAGFDGVELHYAHAYTMASFLSARNTRDDGYGGPRENRVRLPLDVFRAVRR